MHMAALQAIFSLPPWIKQRMGQRACAACKWHLQLLIQLLFQAFANAVLLVGFNLALQIDKPRMAVDMPHMRPKGFERPGGINCFTA
jgi:hypothetical protein